MNKKERIERLEEDNNRILEKLEDYKDRLQNHEDRKE